MYSKYVSVCQIARSEMHQSQLIAGGNQHNGNRTKELCTVKIGNGYLFCHAHGNNLSNTQARIEQQARIIGQESIATRTVINRTINNITIRVTAEIL